MTSPASTASSGFAGVLVGTLGTSYIVSMLLRNSIGVIAPDLAAELGLSAAQIGTLSSAFFLSFAVMQIPLGIAIDRYGPKRCMLAGAILSIAAILLFATAITPADLIMARILMGVGMSCYLMAPLALYANRFSADRFAALAGLQIGLGSIGALLATAPLAFAAAVIGWRVSFEVIAAVMAVIGILIAVVVADTSRPSGPDLESLRRSLGGVAAVLRIPGVGRLFFMHMATYSSFALVVGLWGGPYLSHAYGYGLTERGSILLLPAMTQIVGSIAWGASERMFASHKRPALAGGWLAVALLIVIALVGTMPVTVLFVWLAVFGFCAAFTPLVIAHGKSLFRPHLVGRGITVFNTGTMAGGFVSRIVSGGVIELFPTQNGAYPLVAYQIVFLLQAAFVATALTFYGKVKDPLPL